MLYTIDLTLDQRKLLVTAINSAKITYHANNIMFPELMTLEAIVKTAPTKKEDSNPFTAESLLLFAHYCIFNGIEIPQINHVNAWIKESSNIEDTRIESAIAGLNVSCKAPNPLNMAVDIAVAQSKKTVTGIVSIIRIPQKGYVVVSSDTLEHISNYELIAEYRDGKETFENVKD